MAHRPLWIAHRGMPRLARENTIESFRWALDAGADGIELDVHATRDGVVVVHHDAWTSDGLEIERVTRAALEAGDRQRGFAIPALRDVAALVGDRAELFVEIKGHRIEAAVLDALTDHTGPTAIHSFDHAAISRVARLDPSRRLGLLLEDPIPDAPALLRAHGARDLWPRYTIVDAALVESVHAAGGRVIPWTVNDPRDVVRLRTLRVDGICTDDVALLGGV